MTVLGSYLWRFWRRKSTCLGLIFLAVGFLVCVHYSGKLSSNPAPWEEKKVSVRKKLQQTNDAPPVGRGVHFIPGVPGHSKKRVVKNMNKEVKVPGPVYRKVIPIPDSAFHENMDLQPAGDFNVEEDNGRLISNDLHAPSFGLYRGDIPAETDKDRPPYIAKQRLIHLDLKGAPPNVDYIVKVLTLSRNAGATGVLLEYEDMFPFAGKLSVSVAKNHYTRADVQRILEECERLKLDVIPLVQTFGHLEFVLKHKEYENLRDVYAMPESLCPCHPDAMPLVRDIVDQVMALHKGAKFLHIGCDEVFHLGECDSCQGQSRTDVFVQHVARVAQYVKDKYGITSIIWDDMLRNFMAAEMQPLVGLVEPMLWVYAEDVYRFMPSFNFDRFAEVFDTVWTASAFKGADGPTLAIPNVQRRLNNHVAWIEVMGAEEHKFKDGFRGIVTTGWQRYDHFATLCELLPASIPSLVVNLLTLSNGYYNSSLQTATYKGLDCADSPKYESFIDLDNDPYMWDKMSWCFFPGASFYKLVRSLQYTQKETQEFLTKYKGDQAWLSDFSVRHNFSTPFRINEMMDEWPRYYYSVVNLIKSAKQSLSEIFDLYTTAEWIEQKIYPMIVELKKLKAEAESLMLRRRWPARPFEPLPELREFGVGVASTEAPPPPMPDHASKNSGDTVHVQANNVQYSPLADNYPRVSIVTPRPKRLVQPPDYYRHPPGSK